MKLPLIYLGNPILRKKSIEVEEITEELRSFVNDMVETMHATNGIGLAAPQVGQNIRLFITQVPIQSEEDVEELEEGPLLVFINPTLSNPSEEAWVYSEGCLSIPKVYAPVIRPYKIRARAMNLDGEWFEEEYSGLQARAIMHENDHINGTLFIDRLAKDERKKIEPDLIRVKKTYE